MIYTTKKLFYCHTQTSSGATAYMESPGAGNTVPLLFSNVRCTGSEGMLTSCPYDSNLGDCTLSQPAAGVTCHMCKPGLVVLFEMKEEFTQLCIQLYTPEETLP